MSRKHIPPELVDEIIANLNFDTRALRACSLCCRAWFPTSRYHLFSKGTLTLTSHRQQEFIALLNSSLPTLPLAPFIRSLSIVEEIYYGRTIQHMWLAKSLPLLKPLSYVTRLSVDFLRWDVLGAESREAFTSTFSLLTELSLTSAHFVTFAQFANVVCQYPSLEHLYIKGLEWDDYSHEIPPYLSNLPALNSLHTLDVGGWQRDVILPWLLSQKHTYASLGSVTLDDVQYTECDAVSTFLQALGDALKHVSIGTWHWDEEWLLTAFDLSANTQLRSITFREEDHSGIPARTMIPAIITSRISSDYLESLRFFMRGEFFAGNSEWDVLSKALLEPRFAQLKCIRFDISAYSQDPWGVPKVMRKRLPYFDERDVLTFDFIG